MSKTDSVKQFFRTYISTIKVAWDTKPLYLLAVTSTGAIRGLLVLPQLLITKLIIDTVTTAILTQNVEQALPPLIFASALAFLINTIRSYFDNLNGVFGNSLSRHLQENILINISSKLNILEIRNAENPETRNTFQKVFDNTGNSIWSLVQSLSNIPETIFNIISSAILVASYHPLLLLPGILLSVPSIIVGNKYSKLYHQFRTQNASLWRLWEAFQAFTTKGRYLYENKMLGHTDNLLNRRRKLGYEIFSKQLSIDKANANSRRLTAIPNDLFDMLFRIFLYYEAITRIITLGTAQMVSNAFGNFVGNLSWLIRQSSDVFRNYLFVKDYEDFMALPDEASISGNHLPGTLTQGIEFRNVWFKYPSSKNWILKGVSFRVDPTDNIAIVGVNGAGKSTLIKLLCRFYQPEKGEILVNNQNINSYNIHQYRNSIAALFQDFAQYPFSAKDNIRFGAIFEKSSRKKIKHAAHLAGIDNFINSLPLGYDNPLDKEFKDGIEPSKGQWQRIALARTLYRNSPIVVLDEPTSNVDPESEEEIFKKILEVAANKSVILISHRFSTVKIADQILVLEDGVITQQGSHEELMRQRGSYHRLFTLQAKSYTS